MRRRNTITPQTLAFLLITLNLWSVFLEFGVFPESEDQYFPSKVSQTDSRITVWFKSGWYVFREVVCKIDEVCVIELLYYNYSSMYPSNNDGSEYI